MDTERERREKYEKVLRESRRREKGVKVRLRYRLRREERERQLIEGDGEGLDPSKKLDACDY